MSVIAKAFIALAIALSSPVYAGLDDPSAGPKWIWITRDIALDTDDIKIQGHNLRLYYQGPLGGRKLRIRCSQKSYRVERYLGWDYGWNASNWQSLVDGTVFYEIASQLCFLTGAPNATPDPLQPEWAKKIIRKVKSR